MSVFTKEQTAALVKMVAEKAAKTPCRCIHCMVRVALAVANAKAKAGK